MSEDGAPEWRDGIQLGGLVASREVAATELVEAGIARVERWNPVLGAVIHTRYDAARDEAVNPDLAAGPFQGVPTLLKDLGADEAGEPHHQGATFLRDLDWRATEDSYLAAGLRALGLISLGRTNTPEFGSTITTEPVAYGPARNPWALDSSTGGSSGGAAAAVAAGVVPVAHGNDGGGSLRIPASCCGLVGLKPSRGRVSVGPLAGEHRGGFGVDGVLTRTVRDTAAALDGISGPKLGDPYSLSRFDPPLRSLLDGPLPPLRVGVAVRRAHPECVAAAERAAALLSDAGHAVVDAAPRRWFDPMLADTSVVVRTAAMARSLDAWGHRIGRPLTEADVEPANWYSAQLGGSLPATAYLEARDWLNEWSRAVAAWWTEFDVLLTPVLGAPPPPLGFLSDPDEGQQRLRELLGFADQANASGQPAVSLPLHWTGDGLPVGVQFVAAGGREDVLVRLARWFELAVPWADRHPPLG